MSVCISMFNFGSIVVVDENQIGVVVKSWADNTHDVYVRSYNGVNNYKASDMKQYIYSKELAEDELEFYQA